MAESICLKCEHKYVCATGKSQPRENTTITGCSRFAERTPFTNADRIRAMSDEELAEAFAMQCAGRVCKGIPFDGKNECVKCWLDWLQQEVYNGDSD